MSLARLSQSHHYQRSPAGRHGWDLGLTSRLRAAHLFQAAGALCAKFVLHELNQTTSVARQYITLPMGTFEQLRIGLRIGRSHDASDTSDGAANITVTYYTFTLR